MTMQDSQNGDMTLVLGVGNPLMGDDGAGIRIVEMLAEQDLPLNVKVEEAGTPGWGLPTWLEGWKSVIIVDAVRMGQKPGTWRRFNAHEMQLLTEDSPLSLHQPDLAGGMALAQALDLLPENIVFYGVEPACTDPGREMSHAVSSCLPGLVEKIIQDLGKREV
jgi:hydrogenase maturation protease